MPRPAIPIALPSAYPLGTDEPRETAEAQRIRLTGDAGALVEALLPHQHPMLGCWDHF